MVKTVAFILLLYVLLVLALFIGQRRLMYHPVKMTGTPQEYGLAQTTAHAITATDGTKLEIWQHAARAGFPTLLYFHGNAGNLSDRAAIFQGFIDAGFGVVALEYRGFGKSEGTPSEEGIYQDARGAIDYAVTQLHIPYTELIYYGESLGSGVAVQMATERPSSLLMLEAAYTSVATRSAELFPFVIGMPYLVLDRYDSLSKITQVHAPLVMIHGENDPVIPYRHGQTLFAAAGEPKSFTLYPNTGHVDFSTEQRVIPLLAMCHKIGLVK